MRQPARCVALVAAMLSAAPAIAQPAASAADRKKAKAYVDAGLVAQADRDYEGAIALYRKAYELVPHPTLLFNLAQAHRLAGRQREALELYRRYVAVAPETSLAREAQQWIAALEAAGAETPPEPVVLEPPAPTPPSAAVTAPVAPIDPVRPVVISEPPPAADPGARWRTVGIAMASTGAVALIAGAAFGLRARNIDDELSEHNAPYSEARDEEGRRANAIMLGLYGVGGLLVVGGVTTYLLTPRRDERAPVVSASVQPGLVGLSVGGSF